MHLYDTAARAVRPFEPAGDPVSIYVCGITPYDAAHLGHAFTYHVFDVITRRLLAAGRQVRSIRNVTDVDDDILRVARERRVDFRVLAEEQMERFDREMSAIDLLAVTAAPRATEHVPSMVEWIARLERDGYAYVRDGWVYFEVARFDHYGRLSGLDREQMLALSRQRGADPDDPRKRDPLDFVLWQPSLDDEPRWSSPWGPGRPGWHIECSVLATEHLGPSIDMHGGGEDLVYPHHESEIAQVEATGAHPFARHWVHVAMVGLEGEKMSKSLGNLVFVRDCLRTSPAAAVRLLLGSHHHRRAWTFEEEDLARARERCRRYHGCLVETGSLDHDAAAELERDYFARLDDDLDTPGALAVIDRLAAEVAARPGPPARGAVDGGLLLGRLLSVVGVDLRTVAAPPLAG